MRAGLLTALLSLLIVGCGGGPDGSAPPDRSPAGATAGPPWFEEVAAERGLDFRHDSGHDVRHLFPEIIAGGVALLDVELDGDLDVYFVQSGRITDGPNPAGRNRLYLNDGQGNFRDATEGSGADDDGYGMGVATGDVDGDGDLDLYVTNLGPNALLRNDGDGTFTDVTGAAGVGDPSWGTSATFVDHDADGDLDLFITNYVAWSLRIEQDCYNRAGGLDYCLPTNYRAPARDTLYRNDGDGAFTDVSTESGLEAAFGNGLGVVAGDFDDDGRQDVFVANDTMLNQLWMNQGGGRFVDESLLRGCALDEHGRAKAGMGVDAADIDHDGDLDLLVVNLEGQTDSFFRNDGGLFQDSTGSIGLGTVSRGFTRFGIGLQDLDNDGHLDLYQANGRVVKSQESETDDPYAESNVVFEGDGRGGFREVLPRGGTPEELIRTSRGAAFGDVDGDGGVDVVVVNRDGPAFLLRNVVPDRGRWVRFRLLDGGSDALGARLTLEVDGRTVRRDVRTSYGYCAASDPRIHVGLGDATAVGEVTVRWIDGTVERFTGAAAGQENVLRRGAGVPAS